MQRGHLANEYYTTGPGQSPAQDVVIKKPKKSGSEFFNYKGYFSLVLLSLVDADYKFLHYFLLRDNAFALMPWLVKPYSRHQLTREERISNYRISRGRRVVENSFGILVNRFRVLLTTMEQRLKVVRDRVLTCVVLHNMLRSHEGDQTDHPLLLMTYNHHWGTRGNRDIKRTSETHQGRPNINKTY